MVRINPVWVLPLLITACGTPQEQCIRRATGELRKVERLIAEVEGNLARGYTYEERTRTQWDWQTCVAPGSGVNGQPVRTTMCWEPEEVTYRDEVPIDPAVEKRKMANLLDRRRALVREAAPAIGACKATHPE